MPRGDTNIGQDPQFNSNQNANTPNMDKDPIVKRQPGGTDAKPKPGDIDTSQSAKESQPSQPSQPKPKPVQDTQSIKDLVAAQKKAADERREANKKESSQPVSDVIPTIEVDKIANQPVVDTASELIAAPNAAQEIAPIRPSELITDQRLQSSEVVNPTTGEVFSIPFADVQDVAFEDVATPTNEAKEAAPATKPSRPTELDKVPEGYVASTVNDVEESGFLGGPAQFENVNDPTDTITVSKKAVDDFQKKYQYTAARSEIPSEETVETTTNTEPVATTKNVEEVLEQRDTTREPVGETTDTRPSDVTPVPSDESTESQAKSKIEQSIEENMARIESSLRRNKLNLQSTKIDIVNGKKVETLSPEIYDELNTTLDDIGVKNNEENRGIMFQVFKLYRSVSTDRKGLIFGKNPSEVFISDNEFITFLKEIRSNIKETGHPFTYTNPLYQMAGVYRFPSIPTYEVAGMFTSTTDKSSPLYGMSIKEFMDIGKANWEHRVLPNYSNRANVDQMEVLFDMIDTVTRMNGEKQSLSGRVPGSRVSMEELLDSESKLATISNNENILVEVQKERNARILRGEARRAKKKRDGLVDQDKNYIKFNEANKDLDGYALNLATAGSRGDVLDKAMRVVSGIARTSGTFMRAPLMMTAPLEASQGLAIRELDSMLRRLPWSDTHGTDKTTKRSLEIISTPENINEVMGALSIVEGSQGFDVLDELITNGQSLAKPNREQQQAANSATERSKLDKVGDFTTDVANRSMELTTGEWAWRAARARLWLKVATAQLQKESIDNGFTLTPEQIETALISDPQAFIREAMSLQAGQKALQYISNTTLGGIDPVTNTLSVIANKYPKAEFLVAASTSWFIRYGYKATMRILPYSSTAIFLAKKLGTNNVRKLLGHNEGDIADSNRYLYAGNEAFISGLAQNLALDTIQLGGTAMAATLLCLSIIQASGGIEPPDKEEEYGHLWYEWKIGGKAIKESWYSHDLFGLGMPAAIAIMAGAKKNDNSVAGKILLNGVSDKILNGSPLGNVGEIFDMFNNFDRNFVEAQMRSEGNVDKGKIEMENFGIIQARSFIIQRAIATFEPAVIRDFYNDNGLFRQRVPAHSKNVIWRDETNDPTNPDHIDDVKLTTFSDAELRRSVYGSPLASGLANIVNGIGFDDDKDGATGYMKHQMPLIQRSDEGQKAQADLLKIYDDNGEEVPADLWTQEQHDQVVNRTLEIVGMGKTPSWLAGNEYVIPYDARVATSLVLRDRRQLLWDLWNAQDEQRLFWSNDFNENKVLGNDAFSYTQNETNRLKELDSLLWDDTIPYTPTKYNRWETEYNPVYRYKNSGEPADPLAHLWDSITGQNNIEMELYASGNYKSPLLPWLTVQNPDNSFNAQTRAAWQNSETDPAFMEARDKGKIIEQGANKGEDLWDIKTGGGGRSMESGKGYDPQFVFSERAHFPAEQPRYEKPDLDKLSNTAASSSINAALASQLADAKSNYSGGNSYGGYSSGGGGGGGYAPSIYSHPAYSLNADSPKGIYTKTPSYAKFDYLRPGFQTKGSREAYRREDI